MASAKQSSVVKRKLQRKQALFLKHEPNSGIRFQEEPSCHIFIANGGLQNGLSRDLLKHFVTEPLLCGSGDLKQLYLPAGEDYAFATFASPKAASEAITGLNGSCIQEMSRSGPDNLLRLLNPKLLSGPPLHLYLCFVDRIPLSCTYSEPCSTELPPGLTLIEEFVSVEEEELLLDFFGMPTHASFSDHMHSKCTSKPLMQESACHGDRETSVRFSAPENVLRHRHVKHYGYEFLYHSSNVDPETPLPGGLPDACKPLLKRMMERKLVETEPDQLTVNYYLPGAGTCHSMPTLVCCSSWSCIFNLYRNTTSR